MISKCWCEGIIRQPLAHRIPGWWLKGLIVRFGNVLSMFSVIVRDLAEIVIQFLVMDRSSHSPGVRRKRRRRRRSEVPSCHELKKQQLIRSKQFCTLSKGNVNECIASELKHCVKDTKNWYDLKHCQDASVDPVNNSSFLGCPATQTSICLDILELGTKNGRWEAPHRVVDWLLLSKIIIATSLIAFTFHY